MTATTREMTRAIKTIVKGLAEQKIAPESINKILSTTRAATAETGQDHDQLLDKLRDFSKAVTDLQPKGITFDTSQLLTLADKQLAALNNRPLTSSIRPNKSANQKMLDAFDSVISDIAKKAEGDRHEEAFRERTKQELKGNLFFTFNTTHDNGVFRHAEFTYKQITDPLKIPQNTPYRELRMCPNTEQNRQLLLQNQRPKGGVKVSDKEYTIPIISEILKERQTPVSAVGAVSRVGAINSERQR